jgi:hypothetical protein
VLEILDYLVQLIEEIMEDPGRTLPEVILWFLLPVLPHVVHVPTWLAALGGLPALLAHAGGLLLAPHFLTHAPAVTFGATVTVSRGGSCPTDVRDGARVEPVSVTASMSLGISRRV